MHVPETLFDAVARGEMSRELLDEVTLEHLAALCPVCAESITAHEARRRHPGGWSRVESLDPVERLRRRLGLRELELRAHEEEARRWVREVLKLDPEERRDKVFGAYVRFRGPLFGVLLLEEARQRIPADPAEALSLADAVLASCKKTAVYQPDPEIQAPALAVRGNARRALGRLLDAEADLEEAQRLADAPGVTDPSTPAELSSYLGSLRKDQGRFEEAAHHLHRAAALYQLLRDCDKAARTLLTLGTLHFRRHELDAAVGVAEQALELLTSESEVWLRSSAHFNRAYYLQARGDVDQAEAELSAHEELLAGEGDWGALHVVWLRARIAWSRGDLRTAERSYIEARRRALERGVAFDAALVALELALVHLVQGRTPKVKKLALEALRVFAEQDVDREVRAALDLLEAAARRDALTRELVERAIAALEGARPARPTSGR